MTAEYSLPLLLQRGDVGLVHDREVDGGLARSDRATRRSCGEHRGTGCAAAMPSALSAGSGAASADAAGLAGRPAGAPARLVFGAVVAMRSGNAWTSLAVTRPPRPVPGTRLMSTRSSRAMRRTAGVASALVGGATWAAAAAGRVNLVGDRQRRINRADDGAGILVASVALGVGLDLGRGSGAGIPACRRTGCRCAGRLVATRACCRR